MAAGDREVIEVHHGSDPRTDEATRIVAQLVALMRAVLECEDVLLYEFVQHGHHVHFAEVFAGGVEPFIGASHRIEGRPVADYLAPVDAFDDDLWIGDLWAVDSFSVVDRASLGPRKAVESHWQPGEIAATLGATITIDGVILGGLWGVRRTGQPPFSRARCRAARRRMDQFKHLFGRLCEARKASSRPPGARSVIAFDLGGRPIASTPDAAPWLSAPSTRARLAEPISMMARREAGRTTLFVRRAPVHLRRLDGDQQIVVALATEGHRYRPGPREMLTYTQRRVADLAVVGATVDEIARALDRQPSTVHHHFKGIYRRLGIGSRSELAHVLRPAGCPE